MIISFAWTTGALLAGRKTVTRRESWTPGYFKRWQDAWDKSRNRRDKDRLKYRIHDAYDRSPRNGGRKVGSIVLTCRPYLEPLCAMPESDLEAEGGLWPTLDAFIGDTDPRKPIPVIRFEFRPLELDVPGVVAVRRGPSGTYLTVDPDAARAARAGQPGLFDNKGEPTWTT